jgi:hypothetical protein
LRGITIRQCSNGIQKGYRFTVSGGSRTDVPVVEVRDVISETGKGE